VPGKYVEYDRVKDLTHLSNVLHNAVNFFEIILSDVMVTGECLSNEEVGDSTKMSIQEKSTSGDVPEPEGKPTRSANY